MCVCEGGLTSREVYPAWVILPSALVAPTFFSSSAFSSAGKGARRSSRATEKGMSGSPGLLASIHALIRGSLGGVCMSCCGEGDKGDLMQPFVFLTDVVLLG